MEKQKFGIGSPKKSVEQFAMVDEICNKFCNYKLIREYISQCKIVLEHKLSSALKDINFKSSALHNETNHKIIEDMRDQQDKLKDLNAKMLIDYRSALEATKSFFQHSVINPQCNLLGPEQLGVSLNKHKKKFMKIKNRLLKIRLSNATIPSDRFEKYELMWSNLYKEYNNIQTIVDVYLKNYNSGIAATSFYRGASYLVHTNEDYLVSLEVNPNYNPDRVVEWVFIKPCMNSNDFLKNIEDSVAGIAKATKIALKKKRAEDMKRSKPTEIDAHSKIFKPTESLDVLKSVENPETCLLKQQSPTILKL